MKWVLPSVMKAKPAEWFRSHLWFFLTIPFITNSSCLISNDSAAGFSSASTTNDDVNRTPFKVKAYGLKHPLAKGYNKSIETDWKLFIVQSKHWAWRSGTDNKTGTYRKGKRLFSLLAFVFCTVTPAKKGGNTMEPKTTKKPSRKLVVFKRELPFYL